MYVESPNESTKKITITNKQDTKLIYKKRIIFLYTSSEQSDNGIKTYPEYHQRSWSSRNKYNTVCARPVHWILQNIAEKLKN